MAFALGVLDGASWLRAQTHLVIRAHTLGVAISSGSRHSRIADSRIRYINHENHMRLDSARMVRQCEAVVARQHGEQQDRE